MTRAFTLTSLIIGLTAGAVSAAPAYKFVFTANLPGFSLPISQAEKEQAWTEHAQNSGYALPVPSLWRDGISWGTDASNAGLTDLPDVPYPATALDYDLGSGIDLENSSLVNVDALNGITEMNGALKLSGNDLVDVTGLSTLTRVGNDLDLRRNYSLTNLDGFESLTEATGIVYLSFTGIEDIRGMRNLSNFSELRIEDRTLTHRAPMSSPLCQDIQASPFLLRDQLGGSGPTIDDICV